MNKLRRNVVYVFSIFDEYAITPIMMIMIIIILSTALDNFSGHTPLVYGQS